MPASSLSTLRTGLLALAALAVALPGCKEEDEGPSKLFEEDGVWSLQRYELTGMSTMLNEVNPSARRDAFLLKLDSANNVATAAWCGLDETDTPNNSLCRQQPLDADWYCRCFAYAYEEDRMRWVEFDAGSTVPIVELDDPPPGGGGGAGNEAGNGEETGETGGEDDGGAGADDEGASAGRGTEIRVSEVPTAASTYDFIPLPQGVFGSNGETSAFRFQRKAARVFDDAVTCTPCVSE